MAIEIKMPQLSDTMSEGTILKWLKDEGDVIERGEALAEVATDKADLEIECFEQGTLLKRYASVGQKVQVGAVIAMIGVDGEVVPDSAPVVTPSKSDPEPASEPPVVEASHAQPVEQPQVDAVGERIKISPLARNLAQSSGLEIGSIQGSGEGGRIVKSDVEAAISKSAVPSKQTVATTAMPPLPSGSAEISRMRATIADRMLQSKTTIPHFYMTTKVHVDALVSARQALKAHPLYHGITYNHFVIKAVALALRAVPQVNARLQGDRLVYPGEVNVGIVTALEDGLLIPVLKQADELSMADVVEQTNGLVTRARAARPKADDLLGATFSVSNVGPYDVEHFAAIISPGQGAILAVSSFVEEALVSNTQIVPGTVMRATLSADHRIIDGVFAAEFLKEFKRVLEEPVLLVA